MQHPSSDARYCVYIVVYIIKFLHQQLMDLGSKLKKKGHQIRQSERLEAHEIHETWSRGDPRGEPFST